MTDAEVMFVPLLTQKLHALIACYMGQNAAELHALFLMLWACSSCSLGLGNVVCSIVLGYDLCVVSSWSFHWDAVCTHRLLLFAEDTNDLQTEMLTRMSALTTS